MTKNQELEMQKYLQKLVKDKILTTGREALIFKFSYEKAFSLKDVVKSLPQDNFCIVCNLPTDGEKCYSKRCPV